MDQEQLFLAAVRENRDKMFRIAMSLLHAGADAEDAVEATWKHFHTIRNPEAISAYLVRSVINISKSELRRRKPRVPLESVEHLLVSDTGSDPLFEYICGLEEKYRLPLVLRMQEKMTDREIAAALHIPRGTVSTRINRALKILKEQMTKEDMDCAVQCC